MIKVVGGFLLDLIETLMIGLSIFAVVYLFLMQPHQVSGDSMYPTLETGDYVLTDKISYRMGEPQRGDIVVFHAPPAAQCPQGTGCDYIKRIIAIPGDTVEVRDQEFYVNGNKLDERYLDEDVDTTAHSFIGNRAATMGEDEYFVSGDNRPRSSDSRAWGPISSKDIVGRAFFRYWPMSALSTLTGYDYGL
ncbi:MAG: signal peptidase I [Patescibacteria group bacterium]